VHENRKNLLKLLPSVLALLVFAGISFAQDLSSFAPEEQVAKINALLAKKGGKPGWVAGITSLSRLSPEEWALRNGLNFRPLKAPPIAKSELEIDTPAGIDWRNNGGNYVSGIRNQGTCGSCWAFSLTAGLEAYVMRTRRRPGAAPDLSEQVMLSCSGLGSCMGATSLDGDYIKTTGLPPEKDYPYIAGNGDCAAAAQGWQQRTEKIMSWSSIPQELSALKAALVKFGPLPTALLAFQDLEHYKSGIYTHVAGILPLGHAVLLVGYNDAEQYFIVKNSWGTDWGEDGYFRIAYSQMDNEVRFGISTVAMQETPSSAASPLQQKLEASGFNMGRPDDALPLRQLSAF